MQTVLTCTESALKARRCANMFLRDEIRKFVGAHKSRSTIRMLCGSCWDRHAFIAETNIRTHRGFLQRCFPSRAYAGARKIDCRCFNYVDERFGPVRVFDAALQTEYRHHSESAGGRHRSSARHGSARRRWRCLCTFPNRQNRRSSPKDMAWNAIRSCTTTLCWSGQRAIQPVSEAWRMLRKRLRLSRTSQQPSYRVGIIREPICVNSCSGTRTLGSTSKNSTALGTNRLSGGWTPTLHIARAHRRLCTLRPRHLDFFQKQGRPSNLGGRRPTHVQSVRRHSGEPRQTSEGAKRVGPDVHQQADIAWGPTGHRRLQGWWQAVVFSERHWS